MSLISGTRLGPYAVVSALGAGGMGEVYRARDTRLRREVALKVLPAEVATDPGRRARFEHEAHAAAALNHPNILAIHDIGTESGVSYMATELVSGETLAAVIERRPVPIRMLLDLGVQIADGMASAHAAGVVHRDLKPANIMITADGRVKILDFGLAKQTAAAAVAVEETRLDDRTQPGIIVGTVNYMSPEQARGSIVDYRSDQFSFGLVLYEMATGRKPFARADSVQTMAAIISEEPPPIGGRVPAPLRWVIDRCLAKDPAGRYESSRDLFRDLASIRDHLSEISTEVQAAGAIAAGRLKSRRHWLVPAAVALVAATTLAIMVLLSRPALLDQSSYRFTPFSFEPGGQGGAVWSPDGKAVAYAARQKTSEPYQLYVRYLDAPTGVQVTHLTTSTFPVAWSSDSRRMFLLIGEPKPALWSVATVGGDPEPVMSLPEDTRVAADPGMVTISPDNGSVAVFTRFGERYGVGISSPPGSPLKAYAPAPFETKQFFNQPRIRFSPDGKQLLLMLNGGGDREEAWLLPYPADAASRPKPVLADLHPFGFTPTFHWLSDSRYIILSLQITPEDRRQLWLADTVTNARQALTSGTKGKFSPSVAPDGTKLIFAEDSGHFDVVTVDFATLTPQTLISTERHDLMPAWAAAEQALVYVTDRTGPNEIWLHRPGLPDRPLVTDRDFAGRTQWFSSPTLSPKGDRAIYMRRETDANPRLWISSVAGGAPIQLTTGGRGPEHPGSWSPDGAWFVYTAIGDGKVALLKVKTTGQASPVMLKEGNFAAFIPSWSPAGDWIAYGDGLISPDGKTTKPLGNRGTPAYMFSQDGGFVYGLRSEKDRVVLFSINVATGAEKVIGTFSSEFAPGSTVRPSIRFSLSPDGKSFVYASGRFKTNLWMLEGFAEPRHWLAKLFR